MKAIHHMWVATLSGLIFLAGVSISRGNQNEIRDVADVSVYGAYDLDKAGWDFASGDFDGDGNKDLAISSFGAAGGVGTVTILWGSASLDSLVDLRSQTDVSVIVGSNEYTGLLSSLTSGDFNNDEVDDVVISTPWKLGGDSPGVAHIIYGHNGFPDSVILDDDPDHSTTIRAPATTNGFLGLGVCVGDLNGDQYDDLVLSAPYYLDTGELFVIFGADTLPSLVSLNGHLDYGLRIIATGRGESTGESISCGDVNGDGYDELLIGSPGTTAPFLSGRAHLLSGSSAFPDTILLGRPSPDVTVILPEPGYEENAFGKLTSISDINGDQLGDIVVTDPAASPLGCLACGEIYVLYGGQVFPDTITINDTTMTITRLMGGGESEGYGDNITCGDVSGDGVADLIILNDNRFTSGIDKDELIVVEGTHAIVDSVFLAVDSNLTRYYGHEDDDEFGYGLDIADVDNDGVGDLVVGANRADPVGRHEAGRAYIVYGPDSSVLATRRASHPPFFLRQNYPNPFSEITNIEYVLPAGSDVTIGVYNVRGQLVYSASQSRRPAGVNVFQWSGVDRTGRRVPSGIYFYRVEIPGQKALTRKAVLLR